MKSLKIGNLKLKNPLLLSPMVDVTDLAYRLLCRKAGASLAYTEMLYSDAIIHENKKTQMLMKTIPEERPVGIQITGNSEEEFKKVIPYTKDFSLIDINCGCPSIKLIGNKAGSYLLNSPQKIGRMIEILKTSGKPVTAKIRLGFKSNNVLEVSKKIERAGADALTIHGRLAIHGRDVPADWNWVKKVKENIGIPLIGNGDIFTPQDAEKMLEIADGVMIARGAIGNPLIFSKILYYLKNEKIKEYSFKDNLKQFKRYLKLVRKYGLIDIGRIKYLGSNFFRGMEGASKLRMKLMSLKSFEEIEGFVEVIQ